MSLIQAFIDAGPLVAYYNRGDKWHATARTFFENFKGKLFTSEPVATEVMWLLAEKLKAKGFANLFDYYSKEFKDPETGKAPTTALEFSEIATKMKSAPIWAAKEPLKGDAPIMGWAEFRKRAHPSANRSWSAGKLPKGQKQ